MAEKPLLLRIPPEIRMLIYEYLLDNGGTKDIWIRNKSRWEYQASDPKSKQRSVYHSMERSFARQSYETTYCANASHGRSMHTVIMHINRQIREEASHHLYGRHAFHFGEDLEAVVPFLEDKTPRTRDLVREISLHKRRPTHLEQNSCEWAAICRYMRTLPKLDKLTLVIEGGRPRGAWDGPQHLTVSDLRLLYATRHESLDWARELASVKSIGEVEIVADIHHSPEPESNMTLVLAAFSSSIETSLVDFLREELQIPARAGRSTLCRSKNCFQNGCVGGVR